MSEVAHVIERINERIADLEGSIDALERKAISISDSLERLRARQAELEALKNRIRDLMEAEEATDDSHDEEGGDE